MRQVDELIKEIQKVRSAESKKEVRNTDFSYFLSPSSYFSILKYA